MGTHLIDAANSEYVASLNLLRPSNELSEVIIYVEGWDDVAFWTECIRPYMHKKRFSIEIFRSPDGKLVDGKLNILNNVPIDSLGPNLIIAVDADYDWIMDEYKPSLTSPSVSTIIRDNPYILHTYLYSIENYKCHATCLPGIIAKATAITPSVECMSYIEEFSKVMSDLFLVHLVSIDLSDNIYPLRDFISDINYVKFDFEPVCIKPVSRSYINRRLSNFSDYISAHTDKIETIKLKLQGLGFASNNYYLLFKGHCVADTIVKNHFLDLICKLRLRKIRLIQSLADIDVDQACQHMTHYCKITGISEANKISDINLRLTQLINDCSEIYKVQEGYPRIKQDIDRLFA